MDEPFGWVPWPLPVLAVDYWMPDMMQFWTPEEHYVFSNLPGWRPWIKARRQFTLRQSRVRLVKTKYLAAFADYDRLEKQLESLKVEGVAFEPNEVESIVVGLQNATSLRDTLFIEYSELHRQFFEGGLKDYVCQKANESCRLLGIRDEHEWHLWTSALTTSMLHAHDVDGDTDCGE
jgi:hypothetical protein